MLTAPAPRYDCVREQDMRDGVRGVRYLQKAVIEPGRTGCHLDGVGPRPAC